MVSLIWIIGYDFILHSLSSTGCEQITNTSFSFTEFEKRKQWRSERSVVANALCQLQKIHAGTKKSTNIHTSSPNLFCDSKFLTVKVYFPVKYKQCNTIVLLYMWHLKLRRILLNRTVTINRIRSQDPLPPGIGTNCILVHFVGLAIDCLS